jgi:hypothetical protein
MSEDFIFPNTFKILKKSDFKLLKYKKFVVIR